MVLYCYQCKKNSKTHPELGYFRFPNDERRCVLWFTSINKTRLPNQTVQFCHSNLRMCSEHFPPKDLSLNKQRKRLDYDAVPIVCPGRPDEQALSSLTPNLVAQQQLQEKDPVVELFKSTSSDVMDLTVSGYPDEQESSSLTPNTLANEQVQKKVPGVKLFKSAPSDVVDLTESGSSHMEVCAKKINAKETKEVGYWRKSVPQPSTSKPVKSTRDVHIQTPSSLIANMPQNIALKRKVRRLSQQIRRNKLTKSWKDLASSPAPVANFFDIHYTTQIANFIKTQMHLLIKSPKEARYSNKYKQFALTLYFLGPKCYQFLATTFRLPSKSTLMRITKKWPINPGLNDFVFLVLENRIEGMDEADKDCVLYIDEMSLRSNLYYNIRNDEIIGFHNTVKKNFKPGNKAITLMLRGINFDWKQPLAYFFVNSTSPEDDLKTIVLKSIRKLYLINLRVRAVVTNQGPMFLKLPSLLGVTVRSPYFLVKNYKIYYIFDVPSLMKSTRNIFLKYNFYINNNKISKEYLNTFYRKDKTQLYRLAPKLTDAHLNPTSSQRLKAEYAIQVFSATVATALNTFISFDALKPNAVFTVEFIAKMDKLFDLFNSSVLETSKSFNKPFAGEDFQINFLNEMSVLFENLQVRDYKGKKFRVNFAYGWRLTIASLLSLWKDLKGKGFNYILTRRLNQECLDNLFAEIRQQNGNYPTPIQFVRSFKTEFAVAYFDQSERDNCLEDFDHILNQLTADKIESYEILFNTAPDIDRVTLKTTDYRQLNYRQKNAFFHVGGYFLKKCLEKHCCEVCDDYVRENQNDSEEVIYLRSYRNFANGVLKSPDASFFQFYGCCENVFAKNFKNLCISSNVGIELKKMIISIAYAHPCNKFPKDYFATLFVRTRIFYTLQFLSRDIRKTYSKKEKTLQKLKVIQHL